MDETTAPGPSPDGIFAKARREGAVIASAALATTGFVDLDVVVEIGGVRASFGNGEPHRARLLPPDGDDYHDHHEMMALAGMIAGFADALRNFKDEGPF